MHNIKLRVLAQIAMVIQKQMSTGIPYLRVSFLLLTSINTLTLKLLSYRINQQAL